VLANGPLQALPAKASQPLPGREYANQELCNDDVLCSENSSRNDDVLRSENSSHQRVYLVFFSSICFTLFSMKLLDFNFKQSFFLILTSMCILLWMFHMSHDIGHGPLDIWRPK